MRDESILVIARLLEKHMPLKKAINYDSHENFSWLDDLDAEDVDLLFYMKEDIKSKMQSVTSKFGDGWFPALCRRVYMHEKLRDLIFD